MALVVNTNIASLVAQKNLGASQSKLDTAMERLSSGSRINSAADDAAGLAIASRMESQVRGLNQAVRNANDGISLAQTAEGAMEEITAMLQRMRELSVQASNGTNSSADLTAIDSEVQSLKSEIDRIVSNTEFNGRNLLDGSFGTTIQVGDKGGQTVGVNIKNMATASLGAVSGAASSSGVTSATFSGAAATPTVTQLMFDANDTYNFALTLGGLKTAAADTYTFNVSGAVSNGSARGIVDAINAALREIPAVGTTASDTLKGTAVVTSAADSIRATYNGSTVRIENLTGASIKVEAGAYDTAATPVLSGNISASGSHVQYSSISDPASGTNDNKVLAASNLQQTSLINNGPVSSTSSSSSAAVASSVEIGFLAGALGTATALDPDLEAGDRIHFTLTSGSEVLSLDTGSMAATADIGEIVTELQAALAVSGNTNYTIAAGSEDSTNGIKFTRADGRDFTIAVGDNHDLSTTTAQSVVRIAPDLIDGTKSELSYDNSGTATVQLAFNDTNIAAAGANTGVDRADKIQFKLTETGSGAVVNVKTGAISAAAAQATNAEIAAAMQTALNNAGATAYTVQAVSGDSNSLEILRSDGVEFKFEIVAGAETTAAPTSLQARSATTELSSSQSLVAANGKVATTSTGSSSASTSIMYLDLLASDTYTFKGAGIDSSNAIETGTKTNGVSIIYTGTTASLTDAATKLQSELNSIVKSGVTYNFEVTTENGRLKVEERNGNKFAITDFASAGSGKVAASVPSGQNVSGSASAKLLDDTVYATNATTQAAGTVTKTDIDLTFTATDDTFSFNISDGTATAVVTPTVHDADGNGSDILAAVRTALSLSGLDDVMSASVATVGGVNVLTLEHSLGREVTISDFATTGSQTVKAESGATGVTGVAKFLDDNGGNGNSATLSTVVATSSSLASDAIEVIDRALADVNDQRGVLGSVQNRLEHTINNLTNISVNTSAAQSRIEDADYAVEAANLAKAQIMQQAGTAMLAQANAMQQTVLSLLQ